MATLELELVLAAVLVSVAQLAVALVLVATLVLVLEAQALSAEVLELVPALEATEPTMLKLLQLKQHGRFIIWTLD